MRKTGNLRRIISGLLAGMTILSTVLSPMTAYAAEMKPDEKPPLYEEVKDLLDEDAKAGKLSGIDFGEHRV